ncbi:MAG: restriction endonuclease subunit S [Verrucomicrobiales bacterium]
MKNGWQTKRLGDFAATVSTGPFGSILHKSDYVDDGVPLVNPINMVDEGIVPDPSKLISGVTKRRLSSYVLKTGDVVVARRGEIGRCAVIGSREDGWVCGTGSFFIRPLPILDSQFLAHLIRSNGYREKLEQLSTGTTMKNLSNTALGDLAISVPPLPEQQRIVGLLDEAFAGLATAKANAEKNLQNARALFESHLQSVFTLRGKDWVEKSLGEMCEMYQPKTIGTKDLVADGTYPVFGANGVIGRYDKFNHEEPQLLITCRGSTCGAVNISEPKSWITGNAMVVRPKDHALDLRFLEFVFRGGIDISKAITGAAQPQITRTNLSPPLIRYPKSVSDQKRLASTFESLTEETQRLESLYQRKLAALEALKKSLLHQAFTGEL